MESKCEIIPIRKEETVFELNYCNGMNRLMQLLKIVSETMGDNPMPDDDTIKSLATFLYDNKLYELPEIQKELKLFIKIPIEEYTEEEYSPCTFCIIEKGRENRADYLILFNVRLHLTRRYSKC